MLRALGLAATVATAGAGAAAAAGNVEAKAAEESENLVAGKEANSAAVTASRVDRAKTWRNIQRCYDVPRFLFIGTVLSSEKLK